jgi:hypothetical protein
MIDFPPLAGWPAETGFVRDLSYASDTVHAKAHIIRDLSLSLSHLLQAWEKTRSPILIFEMGKELHKLDRTLREIKNLAKKNRDLEAKKEAEQVYESFISLDDFLRKTKKTISGEHFTLFQSAKKPLMLALVLTYLNTHEIAEWSYLLNLFSPSKS